MHSNQLLFVVNPKSGGTDKDPFLQALEEHAKLYHYQYSVLETTGEGDEESVREAVSRYEPDTVVAVGGDGTVKLCSSVVAEEALQLGIIPMGSANGLSTDLGIPANYRRALDVLRNPKVLVMDCILINGEHNCLHFSDLGLNADLIRRFEKGPNRGMLSYGRQLIKELTVSRPHHYTLKSNSWDKDKKVMAHMIAIANAKKLGTGAVINPDGKINDGKFEVCILKPYTFAGLLRLTFAMFLGNPKNLQFVEIHSVDHIQLEGRHARNLQVDGELVGKHQEVEAHIEPKCLKVLVPLNGKQA